MLDIDGFPIDSMHLHPDYARVADHGKRPPHEVITAELVDWGKIMQERSVLLRESELPTVRSIWHHVAPPLGAYYWIRHTTPVGARNLNIDMALCRLERVKVADIIPLYRFKSQWDPRERSKIIQYRKLYSLGPHSSAGDPQPIASLYVDPPILYTDSAGHLVTHDGSKRCIAAALEGLAEIDAWVFSTVDDRAKNRSYYMREATAIESDLPPGEQQLVGVDRPIWSPTLTYQECRRTMYPDVCDQLDAIIAFLVEGKKKPLERIRSAILEVKEKFPKS